VATHYLKEWPRFFEAVASGDKTFEVRRDDRGFEVGDMLVLREWVLPSKRKSEMYVGAYSGRELRVRVTYVLRGPFVDLLGDECVVLAIRKETTNGEKSQEG